MSAEKDHEPVSAVSTPAAVSAGAVDAGDITPDSVGGTNHVLLRCAEQFWSGGVSHGARRFQDYSRESTWCGAQ
jgi:hypothetical protein